MKRCFLLLSMGVGLVALGCNQSPSVEKPVKPRAHQQTKSPSHVQVKANSGLDDAERAIELQAQRAKRDIDEITYEAEDLVRKGRDQLTTKAKKHAQDISESSAELAEDAKDQAEDMPEEVDRAFQKQIESRFRATEKRLKADRDSEEQDLTRDQDPVTREDSEETP